MATKTRKLADSPHSPRVQDVLPVHPSRLLARLIAKPVDLLDSASTLTHQNNKERLMETVKAYVLSLDPCVEYKIEINHA
jgi:hypothetical protein